ncbi:lipoyl(octanoyl) transferase LipB [Arthrobacter sp. KK5.5]|uniref:lipoyl(octanoyl) transferase LipB n=1 Tax=Arthrobacter sp. KK5.5 TaxID=3373084 RepID=UPI003EE4F475
MTINFRRVGFAPSFVDYVTGWDLQRAIHAEVAAGTSEPQVLLLEHAPVYTAGKRTEPEDLPLDGTPVVDVDRGGKLTWHGPGQLVGYPIVELGNRAGIRDYVNRLEEALIRVVAGFGIEAVSVQGRSGVWVLGDGVAPDRKIAAIGIRVDHGVTMHGFALNCSNDLAPYGQIIPCGITDAGVTTISAEAGRTVEPSDVLDRVEEELAAQLLPAVKTTATEGALS